MSPKILFIAAAAFAASAAALPANAASGPDDAGKRPAPLRATIMFNLIDKNSDGAIDQEELAALQKAIFTAIDTDKDGKLTQDEFRKVAAGFEGGPPRGPGGFTRGPGRGPGMGGPGGWPGMHRNGPGGDRQGQIEEQERGPGGEQLGQNEPGQPPKPRDFASLDTNGDGVVSPDEFAAGAPMLPGIPPVR